MILRLVFIAIALSQFLVSEVAQAKVMIFGGRDHDQYLGCLICNEFSSDSICNGFGRYGNEFGSKGMFNEFSGFGNEFLTNSPWNIFSTSQAVPILVDENGNFFGYFTINSSRNDAVNFSGDLKTMYDIHDGDLEEIRKSLCKYFGYNG